MRIAKLGAMYGNVWNRSAYQATVEQAQRRSVSSNIMALARPAVSRCCGFFSKLKLNLLQTKLPPGANRILFIKNLSYNISGEDLYDLFGRYGSIRQIRIGSEQKTKGTAFVVYDDVMDVCEQNLLVFTLLTSLLQAKNALDHLNGFHLQERYIVVLYHMPAKQDAAAAKADLAKREEELAQLKKKHNIGDP